MQLSLLAKRAEKLITDNSPGILTGIGVAGTIATAVLTAKASFRAAEIIAEVNEEENSHRYGDRWVDLLSRDQKIRLVWKQYIPAASTGTLTIAAIVMANHVGTRRAAAVAAAYQISERAFAEYKEKVVEKLGHNKEQKIRDEIAQDRVDARPVGQSEVVILNGDVLCMESYTGRYFTSDMETIKKAQNDTNYEIMQNSYASLGDFQDRIGLKKTSESDEVGWNLDKLMEIEFSTALAEDGRPCVVISYVVTPIRNYHRFH